MSHAQRTETHGNGRWVRLRGDHDRRRGGEKARTSVGGGSWGSGNVSSPGAQKKSAKRQAIGFSKDFVPEGVEEVIHGEGRSMSGSCSSPKGTTEEHALRGGPSDAPVAQKKDSSRKLLHGFMILSCIGVVLVSITLFIIGSSYLNWDYNNPELAVAGVLVHGFEWIFIRVFPFALRALIAGIIITRKKSL